MPKSKARRPSSQITPGNTKKPMKSGASTTPNSPTKAQAASSVDEKFDLNGYLKGLKQEWDRIAWPGRQQVFSETLVVIAVVTFFTVFIFVVDKIFQIIVSIIS